MAEDQDLHLFGIRRPPAEHPRLEKASQSQVANDQTMEHLQQDDGARRRTMALLISALPPEVPAGLTCDTPRATALRVVTLLA